MPREQVVITGLGAFCAAGRTAGELWEAAIQGRRSAVMREFLGGTLRLPVYAADLDSVIQADRRLRRVDRLMALALTAAQEAWRDANATDTDPMRLAVVIGNSRGPVATMVRLARMEEDSPRPTDAPAGVIASVSGAVASLIGARGPAFVVSSSCTSGASAIATAGGLIEGGVADVVVTGGAEAPLHDAVLGPLSAAHALATHGDPAAACRPFAGDRNGTVVGEGAAFLVLESRSHAERRGARLRGRLAGWAIGTESGMRAGQEESGRTLADIMVRALESASLRASDIGYLNLHGTGTPLNDRIEPRAVKRAFGGHSPPASSTKAVTGHCMGASSALEAVLCVQALERQVLPPTWNCDPPDPECDMDLILREPRPCEARHAMSNSSGFWGTHASLILGAAE